jgi:TetR/AcrR family transcriptional regulator, repressor for uid operon
MDTLAKARSEDIPADRNPDGAPDRRARILDAAEHCFVRSGFHRTTMQDVAAEAGMSPGNLYRYFPSKDAIVAGLAERDRARVTADFAEIVGADDFVEGFRALGRKHFEDEPRERAVLCLEIWAEATRNPAFSALVGEFDRDVHDRMVTLFGQAQERGVIAAGVDLDALATLISTMADGLFVRRAVVAGFDPAREFALVMAVMEAAFAGRLDLSLAPGRTTPQETAP